MSNNPKKKTLNKAKNNQETPPQVTTERIKFLQETNFP